MPDTALILIDIQNDYFPGGRWEVSCMAAAADNAARLIAAARAAGTPVLHVRHEIDRVPAPFFAPGSTGAELHPSVAPVEGEPVILKHRPNAFLGTDLGARLSALGAEQLVLAGAMSQMCIDATARAAADLGYRVTVAHDACAARDQVFEGTRVDAASVHATIMAALSGIYAEVVPSDAAIARLSAP